MAAHPFEQLAAQYAEWWATMQVKRQDAAMSAANHLLVNRAAYEAATAATGVPAAFLMAINNRESDGSMHTYLGNGDPLNHRTVNVPRGRGPFSSWQAGAIDALHYDHLDSVTDWSMPRVLYEGELWNGFGYRSHGVRSPYLVGGTNLQQSGRYAGDGNWQSGQWDTQLGIMPVLRSIFLLAPELMIGTASPTLPAPVGVGGDLDVAALQTALNKLTNAGLVVDGSYGRNTRAAVIAFQAANPPLDVDGFAGRLTLAAIKAKQAA